MRRFLLPMAAATLAPALAQPAGEAARELAATRAARSTADDEAHRLTQAATAADARVVAARGQVVDLTRALARSDAALAAGRARLGAAERARASSDAAIAAARAPLATLVATLVRQQRQPAALSLATTPDLQRSMRLRAALAGVTPVIEARSATLRGTLAEAAARQRAATEALASVERQRRERDRQRAELLLAEAKGARQRDAAQADAEAARQQADGLAEQAGTLEALVATFHRRDALVARLAALPGPEPRPGTLPSPAPSTHAYRMPARGRLLAGMGEAAGDGIRTRGLVLAPEPGTIVRAPAGGTIAYAGPFRAWRAIVIVDHGHGWTTLVAGLTTVAARSGAPIAQSAPLGRAGPRLLIELRHHGVPVDVAAIAEAST